MARLVLTCIFVSMIAVTMPFVLITGLIVLVVVLGVQALVRWVRN